MVSEMDHLGKRAKRLNTRPENERENNGVDVGKIRVLNGVRTMCTMDGQTTAVDSY
jgi:hypothetical protein